MTRRFFSGSTLDQAVMMAARHYEIEPDELAYRQIEKKHGFLRTRKAVMIAVDPEQPRRGTEAASAVDPAPREAPTQEVVTAAEAPEAPPQADATVTVGQGTSPDQAWEPEPEPEPAADLTEQAASDPVPEADDQDQAASEMHEGEPVPVAAEPRAAAAPAAEHDEELLGAAENATRTLMRFAGIDAAASARSGGERVEVEVEGPDSSLLVVEGGKGLLAIQHLLPRMLRGLTGRSSFVRVDSEGFHQQRRDRLEALAAKEAEAVSRSGRPRTLPPMAPDERRIVHLALQDSPAVVTESRGSGLHKQVVVRPVAGDGGGDDVEARHGF